MTKNLWSQYLARFGLREEQLRKDNYPRQMVQQPSTGKAIILVHGLSDSPRMMLALAEHFYRLGYSVYLPLLQCHGLREPDGMKGVRLDTWLENVEYAIETAAGDNAHIGIGGLSTGGALAMYFGSTDARISGDIYLFSAALGLADHGIPGLGVLKEMSLRSGFMTLFPPFVSLVGNNPYRYKRVPFNAARELVELMDRISAMLASYSRQGPLGKRIFAAWTEADQVIRVAALRRLAGHLAPENFVTFPIAKAEGVKHACVVLRDDVYAVGSSPSAEPLAKANPRFAAMTAEIDRFIGTSSPPHPADASG